MKGLTITIAWARFAAIAEIVDAAGALVQSRKALHDQGTDDAASAAATTEEYERLATAIEMYNALPMPGDRP